MTQLKRSLAAGLLAAASSIALTSVAIAGEAEDKLVEKVTSAYGGASLTNMRSIRIQDVSKNAFPGQGYTPDYVEFNAFHQDAKIDLTNQRASVEAWAANWNFMFNNRTVTVDDDIVAINYRTGTYQPAASPDFYTAFGPVIRVSDTLLAYELSKAEENVVHGGEAMYVGRPHELITFEIPNSPPLTLYVDAETGYISKMTRETGFGPLTYAFRDHSSSGGVGYAPNFEFFVGEDANVVMMSRNISVNGARASDFRIDRGIEQEGERVDTSEMSVDELADGVHLAGTGPAYTMFVDAGDHIVAVGGYAGLTDRFNAYKEAAGHAKPLRYQIVTHHHTDHLGGMAEAFALGATFVTPANAVGNLNTAVGEDVPEDRLMIVDGSAGVGPVMVHDVWTNHAESYAIAYVPSAKLVFQADHYNGIYVDGPSPANVGSVAFKKAVERLGLEADAILSAHGRKVESWADFEAAVAEFDGNPCIGNRAICR